MNQDTCYTGQQFKRIGLELAGIHHYALCCIANWSICLYKATLKREQDTCDTTTDASPILLKLPIQQAKSSSESRDHRGFMLTIPLVKF